LTLSQRSLNHSLSPHRRLIDKDEKQEEKKTNRTICTEKEKKEKKEKMHCTILFHIKEKKKSKTTPCLLSRKMRPPHTHTRVVGAWAPMRPFVLRAGGGRCFFLCSDDGAW
jgi:hypothetical protein